MRNLRAAVRLFLFVTFTIGLHSVWFIADFFIPNKIYWRQVIFAAWTKSFVRISNMQIEVAGPLPKPPFFLVTNHLSYTDIAAIRAIVPCVFVAKKDIDSWFLAGRICRDMGTIFIDRENRRDIPRAGRQIIERLEQGEGVVVFPEGTSTKGETVLPFNSSFFEFAAKSRTPVSYAAIGYRTPEGELAAHLAACWWEDISFMSHLWRLFKVREYTATIDFGEEPIIDADRKALAAALRDRIAAKFIPVQ
jgi:1-acyl-sn-glycerol-3-phosphate acyltransferase